MSHGNYACTKCDATASSKCVLQRSIFPQDGESCLVGNMNYITKWKEEEFEAIDGRQHSRVIVDMQVVLYPDKEDPREFFLKRLKMFAELSDETLKRAFCDHDWKIIERQLHEEPDIHQGFGH